MKTAFRDSGIVRDEQGNLIGINMGWDFTAEHECGIRDIKTKLGVEGKGYGPNRHVISKPAEVKFGSKMIGKKWYTISCYQYEDANRYLPSSAYEGSEVLSAWSDRSFVVAIKDKAVHKQIMQAIVDGNAIITIDSLFASEANPFSRSGLKILIRSAIPKDWEEQWSEAHKNQERIEKAKDKTGIADRLDKAGKRYLALSPRWTPDTKKGETTHPVIFWLNPQQQDITNYGYFTVEELDAWIRNEGPIPMTRKRV
jgi:hypothetical protein